MLKLFEEQKVSIYKITKDLNLDNMRLRRYATKEISLEKMPSELLMQLSSYFEIEPRLLYKNMKEYLQNKK